MHSASCLIAFSHAGNGCYPDLWIAPYANGKFPLADVSASGSLVHQSDVWNGAFLRRDLYLVNMLNWKCVEGVQNSRATLCLLVSEIPSSYWILWRVSHMIFHPLFAVLLSMLQNQKARHWPNATCFDHRVECWLLQAAAQLFTRPGMYYLFCKLGCVYSSTCTSPKFLNSKTANRLLMRETTSHGINGMESCSWLTAALLPR